ISARQPPGEYHALVPIDRDCAGGDGLRDALDLHSCDCLALVIARSKAFALTVRDFTESELHMIVGSMAADTYLVIHRHPPGRSGSAPCALNRPCIPHDYREAFLVFDDWIDAELWRCVPID